MTSEFLSGLEHEKRVCKKQKTRIKGL